MRPLGGQANKMGAIFAILIAHAGINAEKIRVGAIGAFSQRNTDFWNGQTASVADAKEVFADHIMSAILAVFISLNGTIDLAAHENVRAISRISLDLPEAFIDPMDAVFAENHCLEIFQSLPFGGMNWNESHKILEFLVRLQGGEIRIVFCINPAILVQFHRPA